MPTDWRALTRAAGLSLREGAIEVQFLDGRSQRVSVDDSDPDTLRVWSTAVPPSALQRLAEPNMALWQRNRLSDLVGFKTDSRGRAIGEAWVPTAGLTADEWVVYVRTVAAGCDRLEYLLTGRDEH